jgi:hypothetical protein
MLRQINEYFGIVPDIDLDIMTPDQSLAGMTVDILKKVTGVIKANSPNLVIVQVREVGPNYMLLSHTHKYYDCHCVQLWLELHLYSTKSCTIISQHF